MSLNSSSLEECQVCIVDTHYVNKCKRPLLWFVLLWQALRWVQKVTASREMAPLQGPPSRVREREESVTHHGAVRESCAGDMHGTV